VWVIVPLIRGKPAEVGDCILIGGRIADVGHFILTDCWGWVIVSL
jgi:hypothetical protein